jgi:hypothetical protein
MCLTCLLPVLGKYCARAQNGPDEPIIGANKPGNCGMGQKSVDLNPQDFRQIMMQVLALNRSGTWHEISFTITEKLLFTKSYHYVTLGSHFLCNRNYCGHFRFWRNCSGCCFNCQNPVLYFRRAICINVIAWGHYIQEIAKHR